MNPIERGFAERFLRVEKMISNNAMAEMMYWAGRESYAECLLGAAGVVYWSLRKQQVVIKTIDENSRWMSRFVHLAMRQDENGEIVWKTWISRADGEQLKTLFERKDVYKRQVPPCCTFPVPSLPSYCRNTECPCFPSSSACERI